MVVYIGGICGINVLLEICLGEKVKNVVHEKIVFRSKITQNNIFFDIYRFTHFNGQLGIAACHSQSHK